MRTNVITHVTKHRQEGNYRTTTTKSVPRAQHPISSAFPPFHVRRARQEKFPIRLEDCSDKSHAVHTQLKRKKMAALVHQMLAVITPGFSSLPTVGNLQPAISPKSKFPLQFP